MSRSKSRRAAYVSRWGAVSMAQGDGFERRLRALLDSGAHRKVTGRCASYSAVGLTLLATGALNAIHVREASATVAGIVLPPQGVPPETANRYAANLPGGVSARVIAVSERLRVAAGSRINPQQIWWQPDGTLCSHSPNVRTYDQILIRLAKQSALGRQLWFVLELKGLDGKRRPTFDMTSRTRRAGDIWIMESICKGKLLMEYCCSEPANRHDESFRVGVTDGHWREIYRQPLSGSFARKDQFRKDLGRLKHGMSVPREARLYASNANSSEFSLIRSWSDPARTDGEEMQYVLLDSSGRHLATARGWRSNVKPKYLLEQFAIDASTARQAAYLAIETSPYTYVKFDDVAATPKRDNSK